MTTTQQTKRTALGYWPKRIPLPTFPEGRAEWGNFIGQGSNELKSLHHLVIQMNGVENTYAPIIHFLEGKI